MLMLSRVAPASFAAAFHGGQTPRVALDCAVPSAASLHVVLTQEVWLAAAPVHTALEDRQELLVLPRHVDPVRRSSSRRGSSRAEKLAADTLVGSSIVSAARGGLADLVPSGL